MSFYILIFILFLLPLVWVTMRGKDAFPFSHYPMFSNLRNINDVEVYRIGLVKNDGKFVWWKSEFYRYPEFIGRKLKRLYELENDEVTVFTSLERQRLLNEVSRLIDNETDNLESYITFQIVKRTAYQNEHNMLTIKEEIVENIPVKISQKHST